ncbi:MAG TPA: glycoside hydrolase family 127 protein [Cyclobacteriaceae bacterium]|nr:glycoside hydrolase family 127 protein [Cytophagales bacterium]HNP78008.1 glycoside hydrolase family 127 protein [Cyclobacteriaceae bacterium]
MRKLILLLLLPVIGVNAQAPTRKLEPVNFSQVNITDAFWKPTMEKVATTTLQACIYQTEVKTPRIRNFEKVARNKNEKHEGIFYDDSDVYKALEAIAYSLKTHPDPGIEAKADEWIDKIAAAQLPDGYIGTYYTLGRLNERWSDMSMHEDYNGGHLLEAAVAYYNATGKRKLLDVAIKFADHFDSQFGPGRKHWVTGHQELELALVKLYRVTHNKKYLDMAHWLLEERGHKYAKGYTWTDWKDTAYAQDVVPVRDQKEITGHAVRAMYMYTGAADVAALTGDAGYMKAMNTVWEDVVFRNMYITGGIGSSGNNEGFSNDFDLPNEQAYCETCASVGMVFWNQRMNLLTGDSKFIDVLERSLYNGARDGLSLSGDHFFYGNPLASNGRHFRREWFGTACCPANIARLVASLGDYVYGASDAGLWVNLFVASNTTVKFGKVDVPVAMESNYPWEGNVSVTVNPKSAVAFSMNVRIPGWARGEVAPGELYSFEDKSTANFVITVNGKPAAFTMNQGYATINRTWKKGDKVELVLPMEVRRIVSRPELKQDVERVALQRGPLVYCVEGADNNGKAWDLILPDGAAFKTAFQKDLLEGVTTIQFQAPTVQISGDGQTVTTEVKTITAIPYYAWCNRGQNPMQVWLPRKIKDIKINN